MRALLSLLSFRRATSGTVSREEACVLQLRGAKPILLAQGLLQDLGALEARLAGLEGPRLMAVLTDGPSPTRLERLLSLRDRARDLLATAEAADLGLNGAIDFNLSAEQFCLGREEVRLLDGLLAASADLPVAA